MNAINPQKQASRYKITLIGEQAVGKSSITRKYTKDEFSANILGTTGLEIQKKELIINDEKIIVTIFDSAGHERFRKIAESHYKGSNGLIFVYDITEVKSFEIVNQWLQNIFSEKNEIEVLLIGNKTDLADSRQIAQKDGIELANKFGIGFMETSAKTGENIQESFSSLMNKIHFNNSEKQKREKNNNLRNEENKDNNASGAQGAGNNTNNAQNPQVTIRIDDVKKNKKGCCAS